MELFFGIVLVLSTLTGAVLASTGRRLDVAGMFAFVAIVAVILIVGWRS